MEKNITKAELLKALGGIKKVQNLKSPRSGRDVPNQYDLICENGIAFQSYKTLIAVRICGTLYFTNAHDYSKTTAKYATGWSGFTTAERRAGLSSGRFVKVVD